MYIYKVLSDIIAPIAGVEVCLSSRPLCRMTDDPIIINKNPDDQRPLIPAHFLIGKPLRLPMQEKSEAPPFNIKRLYVQLKFQIHTSILEAMFE